MRMGKENGVQTRRLYGKRRPVAKAEGFVPLEESAIDQEPVPIMLQQIFGPGDGSGAT